MIKFLKDGYCNVSQPIENLKRLGEFRGSLPLFLLTKISLGSTENVDVYAGQGTPL